MSEIAGVIVKSVIYVRLWRLELRRQIVVVDEGRSLFISVHSSERALLRGTLVIY